MCANALGPRASARRALGARLAPIGRHSSARMTSPSVRRRDDEHETDWEADFACDFDGHYSMLLSSIPVARNHVRFEVLATSLRVRRLGRGTPSWSECGAYLRRCQTGCPDVRRRAWVILLTLARFYRARSLCQNSIVPSINSAQIASVCTNPRREILRADWPPRRSLTDNGFATASGHGCSENGGGVPLRFLQLVRRHAMHQAARATWSKTPGHKPTPASPETVPA
jgi:hypothetical protein